MRERSTSPTACGCAAPPLRDAGELRCGCGSLLARVVAGHVELKCRRCKRVWKIPLDGA